MEANEYNLFPPIPIRPFDRVDKNTLLEKVFCPEKVFVSESKVEEAAVPFVESVVPLNKSPVPIKRVFIPADRPDKPFPTKIPERVLEPVPPC